MLQGGRGAAPALTGLASALRDEEGASSKMALSFNFEL